MEEHAISISVGKHLGHAVLSAFLLGFAAAAVHPAQAALPQTPVAYAPGVTAPSGALWLPDNSVYKGHLWISDHLYGFCRLDPKTDNPAVATLNINTCYAVGAAGQAAYDAGRQFVYLPDLSKKGSAIHRLLHDTSDPTGGLVYPMGTLNQGIERPSSVALGPEGALYVASLRNGSITRIVNPWSEDVDGTDFRTKQYKQAAALTSDGKRSFNLAVFDGRLYVAETGTLTRVSNIFTIVRQASRTTPIQYSCAGTCRAADFGSGIFGPLSLHSDGQRLWASDASVVYRLTKTALGFFTKAIYAKGLSFPSAVAVRMPTTGSNRQPVPGSVYVADDFSGGNQIGAGTVWATPYE